MIAQAAVAVIAEKGLEATKLTDIARLAGVTTGAVTHYFSDKDAVLTAALELAYDMMFTHMELVSASGNCSFYEIIVQALPVNDDSRTAMSVWLAFWSRSLAEPRVADQQIEFHHRWHSKVKQELILHCERLAIAIPNDLDDVCEGITAHVNGLIIRALVDASDWPEARQRKVLKTYLSQIGLLA
ncbi:TetR/AcrR family transcriptional regulator [Marinobacterium rhizophilum]|uniref:TetR family transcriptional regulator n=1 Tax=Marinobacterium rhizophilum TaxID=420402 RepID=A0ABY5HKV3_9GAMM|nr:TetR/AcrR family transcriptional regulator [Marinobacterium rhizophilum]UTW11867.1 TetR family transcriptional regulator [Marinobacterium rhizophilum]